MEAAIIQQLDRITATRPNVVGYSQNYCPRIKGGKEVPGTRCLRVYLSKKVSLAELRPEEVVPASLENIETDCVVIGVVLPANQLPMLSPPSFYTSRWETLISGISVGHGSITAGTLGCFVSKDGEDYFLTNWHVAKGEAGQPGDRVYQPGPFDIQAVYGEQPGPHYEAGLLSFFVPVQEGGVDAALVKPTRSYNPDVFVTPVRLSPPKEPTVGMVVLKEGRTTGLTRGTIIDIAATLEINYGGTLGKITFRDQLIIQGKAGAYLAGGDSGSVTREDVGEPERQAAVGLNFAGSTEGIGIANWMTKVAAALGFTFRPGELPPLPPIYEDSNIVEVRIEVKTLVGTRLSFRTDKTVYVVGEAVALSGELVEETTGRPLPGVSVSVLIAELDQTVTLRTDDQGRIQGALTNLAPGQYNLKAQFKP